MTEVKDVVDKKLADKPADKGTAQFLIKKKNIYVSIHPIYDNFGASDDGRIFNINTGKELLAKKTDSGSDSEQDEKKKKRRTVKVSNDDSSKVMTDIRFVYECYHPEEQLGKTQRFDFKDGNRSNIAKDNITVHIAKSKQHLPSKLETLNKQIARLEKLREAVQQKEEETKRNKEKAAKEKEEIKRQKEELKKQNKATNSEEKEDD